MSGVPGAAAALPQPTQASSTAIGARLAPLPGSQAIPLDLPPGSRVVAEVVRSQTDGQVLLRMGQTLLAATLPGDHPVGEKLPLVVLSEPGAPPLLLLASQEPPPAATQSTLSAPAQLLGQLQQQGNEPAAVQQSAPVWPTPPGADRAGLAEALQQSVKSSGLFYESHLAAWVQGQYPMPELLAEPQGRMSPRLADPGPGSTAPDLPPGGPAGAGLAETADPRGGSGLARDMPASATTAAGQAATAPAGASADPRRAESTDPRIRGDASPSPQGAAPAATPAVPARLALQAYAGVQAQPSAAAPQLPAQLQSLVQQQLATLAQGAVAWAGPIWPGQDMQWRIEPDDRGQAAPAEPENRSWTSVLRLDLPAMGQLAVTLRISAGNHLSVRVQHEVAAAGPLRAAQGDLGRALRDAGLQLDEFALQAGTGPGGTAA